MPLFLLNRDKVLPIAQRSPEEIRQIGQKSDHLIILLRLRQPDSRIQRIIQEMRIDLRLQKLRLAQPQCLMITLHIFHQLPDLLGHIVEIIHKKCNFIPRLHILRLCRKITAGDPAGQCTEITYRAGNVSGRPDRKPYRQNNNKKRRQNCKTENCPIILIQLRFDLIEIQRFYINIVTDT